jgi:hypothetical protein
MQRRREKWWGEIPDVCWPLLEYIAGQAKGYALEQKLPKLLRNEDVLTVCDHLGLILRGGSSLNGKSSGPTVELKDAGIAALAFRRLGLSTPSPAIDTIDDAETIRRRTSSRQAELAIGVLEKLRAHSGDRLTAGELNSTGLPSKTIFSASRNWKYGTDYFGRQSASRTYATSRVITYVVEQWAPRPNRKVHGGR